MPPRPPASDLKILIAAGVVMLLLSIASFLVAPVDSASYVTGSSYSPRADGAKAAFLMLKESGYSIERSFEPLTALRRAPDHTVLILAAPVEPPSQQDIRALRNFVEAGGIVLATDRSGGEFLPGVPVPAARDAFPEDLTAVTAAIASPLTAGVPQIEVHRASKPLASVSSYVTVYGDDSSPAVVMARFGSGMAVWWADSWPITNQGISAAGHAELLLNVVGAPKARTVLWDEHYHGHARSLWSYAAGTPLPFVGLQMLLLSLAAILAWSRRKWPIRRPLEVSRTSPLEFVDSMGALYERAGVARAAVATARARARRDLIAAVRAPATTTDTALAAMVADRVGLNPRTVESALTGSGEGAHGADVDNAAAVRLIAEVQRVAAAARSVGRTHSDSGEQNT